jgi:hypothetical protein
MTLTASHEIAEAATDPNVGYGALGWYDDYYNAEIGDIHRYEAVLNGWVVQSLINKYDVAYVPAGATTLRALDAVSGSSLAGLSGQAAAADALFALSAARRRDSADHSGQAVLADALFSQAGLQPAVFPAF